MTKKRDTVVLVTRGEVFQFIPEEDENVLNLWETHASTFWTRTDAVSLFCYKGGRLRNAIHKSILT